MVLIGLALTLSSSIVPDIRLSMALGLFLMAVGAVFVSLLPGNLLLFTVAYWFVLFILVVATLELTKPLSQELHSAHTIQMS